MIPRQLFYLAIAAAVLQSGLLAQQTNGADRPLTVAASEIQQHATHRVMPVYPNIARIAHVQGTVVLKVHITKDGTVKDLHLISGPAMLVQSSIEAVKQWQFHPFLRDGEPSDAETTIRVNFTLQLSEEERRSAYFSRWAEKCKSLIDSGQYPEAEAVCLSAIDAAEDLPQERAADRATAYGDEARALISLNEYGASLNYSQRELELAKKSTAPADLALGRAYYNLARGFHGLGELRQARTYYERARRILNQARKSMGSSEQYTELTRSMLHDYAGLLREGGEMASAGKVERKANAAIPRSR